MWLTGSLVDPAQLRRISKLKFGYKNYQSQKAKRIKGNFLKIE